MIIDLIFILVSSVLILATLASVIELDDWWVRIFDFPRLQITTSIIVLIIFSLVRFKFFGWWPFALNGFLVFCLAYQLSKIYPYTYLAQKQVVKYQGPDEPHNNLSLLVSNVLMTNRDASKLLELIEHQNPEMVLTLESDQWWEDQLNILENSYPYTVKMPMDNSYGMHLYSKLPLEDTKVKYLVQKDIPSIETYVKLNSGRRILLYCLHPMPPSPTESETSTNRDAELLLVGKKINTDKDSVIVCGDLNDVAWSYTTTMFQKVSGLLDPRIGRGFFNTFHAQYPILRWPLDHIFHSSDFSLMTIKRLSKIGSDHFPIYIKLHHEVRDINEHDEPIAEKEDKKWATEKIQKADPIRKIVKSKH